MNQQIIFLVKFLFLYLSVTSDFALTLRWLRVNNLYSQKKIIAASIFSKMNQASSLWSWVQVGQDPLSRCLVHAVKITIRKDGIYSLPRVFI